MANALERSYALIESRQETSCSVNSYVIQCTVHCLMHDFLFGLIVIINTGHAPFIKW